ncbi:Pentatricopeptide repeat-containing protein At1g03540 [Linum grandiflorum]
MFSDAKQPLLALYFKLGSDFVETRRVFDRLNFKDVISWTSMITGYVKVEKPRSTIRLFLEMVESNNVISSALIDMYGRNSAVPDARQLFDELSEPDAICWTSVILAFTKNDMYSEALSFFNSMQRKHGFGLDVFTFGTILTACGNFGRTKQGKELHAKVV